MSERSESRVIREFREAFERGELDKISVVYRVSGGCEPGERVEEEFKLSGDNAASMISRDERTLRGPEQISARLDPEDTRRIFQQTVSGLDSMVPRTEARFLPGSLIGSATIRVEGEEETLYFLADEGQAQGQENLARQARAAIRPLTEISRTLQAEGGGER